jgi:ATP-binding cassette subfamily B (MDR/TAP) protein 1
VLGVIALFANTTQSTSFGVAAERLTRRVREICFKAIVQHDIGWFDSEKNTSGLLASRLASDATLVEAMVGSRLGLAIQNLFTIAIGLGIAFYYGWKLTLVVLATAPMIAFAQAMQMLAMKGSGDASQRAAEEATQVASESIQNMRTVASFTLETQVTTRYRAKLQAPIKLGLKKENLSGFLTGLGEGLMFISYFISFWYGGKLISDGDMSFEDVMKVLMAIMLSAMAIGQSAAMSPNMGKGKQAVSNIFRLVDDKPIIDPFSTEGKTDEIHGNIELRGVKFHYPTRVEVSVLKGLDLKVTPGTVTALVGHSGCGKSSIIGLLERFYDINEGEITIDGIPIKDYNVAYLRQNIALVGQEPVLFNGSIAENIRLGKPEATMEEVEEAAKSANAHNFICQFPDGTYCQPRSFSSS